MSANGPKNAIAKPWLALTPAICVSQAESGELQAFAILRGLAESSRAIELKRIAVATLGQGLGRKILQELMRTTFEEFGAHRMWLDVFDDNARARHLYESLGFVYEGVLREAACRDGEFVSLRLMSLPSIREYAARRRLEQ